MTPVVRVCEVYGAQPGSPDVTKATQVEWAVSATACDGWSPISALVWSSPMLSKTNGISTAWQAP